MPGFRYRDILFRVGASHHPAGVHGMSNTEDAIQNLATAFGALKQPEQHRETYVKSLESFANLVRAELLLEMQLAFNKATAVKH
jgi:hypothetical protein